MHARPRAIAALIAIASVIVLTAGPAPARSLDTDGPTCPPLAAGADCTGVDVSGDSYSGAVLDHITLRGAELAGTDFSWAVLDSAVLEGVDAPGADFSDASLIDASILGANLFKVDLDEADLTEAKANGANFTRASLQDADLEHVEAPDARFIKANGENADFVHATLPRTDFTDATLVDADFTLADLSGADLTNADLSGADLGSVDLTGADLTDANLSGATLTMATLTGATWWNTTCPNGRIVTGAACSDTGVRSESGFLPIPSFEPTIRAAKPDQRLITTAANLWYSYFPADSAAADAPIFVMQNGGPGAATMVNLFANNTAPYTVNLDAIAKANGASGQKRAFVDNPNSWTQMGNVLYIDPALTGFSYNVSTLGANPDYPTIAFGTRLTQMSNGNNLNPWVDADQVLRGVLMFLDAHPRLADNPVVLVGESYGGVRVTTMLNMLLNNGRYAAPSAWPYSDPELSQLIADHFLGDGAAGPVPRERVLQQFGRQILIQPQLSSEQGDVQGELYYRPNSVIDQLAASIDGAPPFSRSMASCPKALKAPSACVTLYWVPQVYGRDQYAYDRPSTFTDVQEIYTLRQLNNMGTLNVLLGNDVARIAGFTPADRKGKAYHSLWRGIEALSDPDAAIVPDSGAVTLDADEADALTGGLAAGWSIDEAVQGILRYFGIDPDTLRYSRMSGHGTLTDVLGPLYSADDYLMAFNMIEWAFYSQITPYVLPYSQVSADTDKVFGDMFLDNARYVNTFLTDAKYDLVIYSPALPIALTRHDGVSAVKATSGEGRPDQLGQFQINYTDGTSAQLYYPFYDRAGHAVAATQPDKIRADVARWLDLDR